MVLLSAVKSITPSIQLQHAQEQEVLTNLNERLAYYVKVNKF